jgi:hypothetical protein
LIHVKKHLNQTTPVGSVTLSNRSSRASEGWLTLPQGSSRIQPTR